MAGPENHDRHLDDEIARLRDELTLVRRPTRVSAVACIQLAQRLRQRATRDDDDAVIDEALRLIDWAIEVLPPDDPSWHSALIERALTLELRFRYSREQADLDTAIVIWRRLASVDPLVQGSPAAEATARLGALLRQQAAVLINAGADDDTVTATLAEAHQTLVAARTCLPADSPSLAETCWLLGLCWGDRYEQERDPHYLNQAIAEIAESLRLTPDLSGDRHYALAKALHERARRHRKANRCGVDDPAVDLASALHHVRAALRTVGPADPFRIEVLWAGVTIAITQTHIAPTDVDVTELRTWVNHILTPPAATDDPPNVPRLAGRSRAHNPDGLLRKRPRRASRNHRR
jgi:hypothetical protein